MNTTILLIRHAETEKNQEKKISGQDDSELTIIGLEQARKTAKYLKSLNISKIYSSDLGRSYKTASIIGKELNLNPIQKKEFRENNISIWKDLTKEEIISRMKEREKKLKLKGFSDEDIRPPKGENTYDHRGRILTGLKDIINIDGTIVIVAHAGTNKVLLGYLNKMSISKYYEIRQDN